MGGLNLTPGGGGAPVELPVDMMRWRGEWEPNPTDPYLTGWTVSYNGTLYICREDNTTQIPDAGPHWQTAGLAVPEPTFAVVHYLTGTGQASFTHSPSYVKEGDLAVLIGGTTGSPFSPVTGWDVFHNPQTLGGGYYGTSLTVLSRKIQPADIGTTVALGPPSAQLQHTAWAILYLRGAHMLNQGVPTTNSNRGNPIIFPAQVASMDNPVILAGVSISAGGPTGMQVPEGSLVNMTRTSGFASFGVGVYAQATAQLSVPNTTGADQGTMRIPIVRSL